MIGNKKGSEDEIETTILNSVPDDHGIFFKDLEDRVSEKTAIKETIISEKIIALIKSGEIWWENRKLRKKIPPPTTHPPSFFC